VSTVSSLNELYSYISIDIENIKYKTENRNIKHSPRSEVICLGCGMEKRFKLGDKKCFRGFKNVGAYRGHI
jgi:RNase P subunit RPR2